MDSTKPQPPLISTPETSVSKSKDDTAVWSLRHIQVLWSWAARPKPTRVPYPPVSSIPHTSAARLSEPDVSPTPFPSEPVLAKTFHQDAPVKPKTVLYLAYGSNMCAETFLGMRGIRPLSQVNVSAPSLDLTFDLPGIPYREPCFANTALRKFPGKKSPFNFSKGLYGVVYEVTLEDYAKIVATEGGGASYHDILVPCIVLPPSVRVPEKPTIPIPPTPFLAHTLYAPRLPDTATGPNPEDNDDNNTDDPSEPETPHRSLPSWLTRLLSPVRRPEPDYAQPSARYLKLLRDGAREHELPTDYQAYLDALQPYTVTTRRQKWGMVLFLGLWMPLLITVMTCGRLFADKRGRSPPWLVACITLMFNLVWRSYDAVGKKIFLDGERTLDSEGSGAAEGRSRRKSSFADRLRGKEEVADEEERALLDGYQ
ncbi:hypothetical protein N657DRAFT_50653 [Parathielavia appendiculata]|uniref:gamma-glutamylcyclotransferase n=1 Tax=Parathielavia appendiculata TaxID=2587402 RepID=A0AAN6Z7W4_9PEZI|nr:hypothetical protein N657DRAFT_50653 [Parathielavia appendiculata]